MTRRRRTSMTLRHFVEHEHRVFNLHTQTIHTQTRSSRHSTTPTPTSSRGCPCRRRCRGIPASLNRAARHTAQLHAIHQPVHISLHLTSSAWSHLTWLNWACCDWLQPRRTGSLHIAHDPVRRGCDQSQRTRLRITIKRGEMRGEIKPCTGSS